MPTREVYGGAFTSSFGRFYAPHRVQAVPSAELKQMFLPRMTDAGRQLIYDHNEHFVRGQFHHYGVRFHEEEFVGCGVSLLQKKLKCGELDRIPMYIQDLKTQMHAEWLHNLTTEDLTEFPDFVLPKYFLDDHGRASFTKMKLLGIDVVSVPFPRDDSHGINQLRKSAEIMSLCHLVTVDTCNDRGKQIIHLGWSEQAVFSVLQNEEEDKSDGDRIQPPTTKTAKRSNETRFEGGTSKAPSAGNKNKKEHSPVGTYEITCEEVEREWPTRTMNMSMRISAAEEAPGIFEAVFQFGVYEGMMVIGSDEAELDKHCRNLEPKDSGSEVCTMSSGDESGKGEEQDETDRPVASNSLGSKRGPLPIRRPLMIAARVGRFIDDDESEEYEDDDDEDGEEGREPSVGPSLKRGPLPTRGPGAKRAAIEGFQSQAVGKPRDCTCSAKKSDTLKTENYFIRLRCRETDGHIHPHVLKGTLKFKGPNFRSFTLVVTDPFHAIADNPAFEGTRFDVEPRNLSCSDVNGRWENYSERVYEWERTSRWGGGWHRW